MNDKQGWHSVTWQQSENKAPVEAEGVNYMGKIEDILEQRKLERELKELGLDDD